MEDRRCVFYLEKTMHSLGKSSISLFLLVSLGIWRLPFVSSFLQSTLQRIGWRPRPRRFLLEGQVFDSYDWFEHFVVRRDWTQCERFWPLVLKYHEKDVPLASFITGGLEIDGNLNTSDSSSYGLTDLKAVNAAGMRFEFHSKDLRYQKRLTFAVRIGYDGNQFNGYQIQKLPKGAEPLRTVEGELKDALGCNTIGAGRTDRGVSAVSQVICFATSNRNTTAEDVLRRLRTSEAVQQGRIAAFECHRVPKKFNSRSSATWRRYLYLFPVLLIEENGAHDVDIDYLNTILGRLEGRELPFNAFAYKEDRATGQGQLDFCTLFRAKAFIVDLPSALPPAALEDNGAVEAAGLPRKPRMLSPLSNLVTPIPTQKAVCIELVGSRFLRRMVRILCATAIKEAAYDYPHESYHSNPDKLQLRNKSEKNEDILVELCRSGDRERAARALPPRPLCLAGVGYDADDLAIYKFMPKHQYNELMLERGLPTKP